MAGLATRALENFKQDNEGKLHPHHVPTLTDDESILQGGRSDVSWEQCRLIINENTDLREIAVAACNDEGIFDEDHDGNPSFWLNQTVASALYTVHKFFEDLTKSPTSDQLASNASSLYSAPFMYRTECPLDNEEFSAMNGMMLSDREMHYLHGGIRDEEIEDELVFAACSSRELVDLSGGTKIPTYNECDIIDEDPSLDNEKTLIPLFLESDSYYKEQLGRYVRRQEFFIGNHYNFLDHRLSDEQHALTKKINMGKNQVFVMTTTLSTYRLLLAKLKGIQQHNENIKDNEGIRSLINDIIVFVNKAIPVLFCHCKGVYNLTKELENLFIKQWEEKDDSYIDDPLPILRMNPPTWEGEAEFLRLFGEGADNQLLGQAKRGKKTGSGMCYMLWEGVRHDDFFAFSRKINEANQPGTANATSAKSTEENSQVDGSNDKTPYVAVPRKDKFAKASEGNGKQGPSKTNELTQAKKGDSGVTGEGNNSTSTKSKKTTSTEEVEHQAPSAKKKRKKTDASGEMPKTKKTKRDTDTKNSSDSATDLDRVKVTSSIVNMLIDHGITSQSLTTVKKKFKPLNRLFPKKHIENLRKKEPHVASMIDSIDNNMLVVTNIVSTKEMKDLARNFVEAELDNISRSFAAKKKEIGKKKNYVPGKP